MDEIEDIIEHAKAAFLAWWGMGLYQTYCRPDLVDDLGAERAFVAHLLRLCGIEDGDEVYDICLNMDDQTASRLLTYVPPGLRAMAPEIGENWRT